MSLSLRKSCFVFSFIVAIIISAVQFASAQGEVSTKVVGFVKAPMGEGFYYYSVPFKKIGSDDTTTYVNKDDDNDGTPDNDGFFSEENFQIGDIIRKFNPNTGTFSRTVVFRNEGGKLGWYEQMPPFGFWALTDMTFIQGEGFLVKFNTPPTSSETYLLGEVDENSVDVNMVTGYNLVGLPYPSSMTLIDAFDEAGGSTCGNSSNPVQSGDFIRADFNGSSWSRTAIYFDGASGKNWYEQMPPFGFWEVSTVQLNPSKAYLYYAKDAFTWTIESPLDND